MLMYSPTMTQNELLKKDLFGEIRLQRSAGTVRIVRSAAVANPWVRWLARYLLRREARALAALEGIDGVPQLVRFDKNRLERAYIDGAAMHRAKPSNRRYFRQCARLLRRLHGANVVHNDLAKEPNLLVRPDGSPALIDFQLAWFTPRRGRIFRLLAWDDIRHLLKHKRTYCPQDLTRRERNILARPSWPSRVFMASVKPVYLFITRRMLGWADREGAADRGEHR
jgi:RIO-like serine/threonine protein kinase